MGNGNTARIGGVRLPLLFNYQLSIINCRLVIQMEEYFYEIYNSMGSIVRSAGGAEYRDGVAGGGANA
jgi:hypothetical protein